MVMALGGAGLVGVFGLAGAAAASRAHSSASRFDGKSVVITGGTSGMGRRAAELFAAEGARVVFCGRREELGRSVEKGIRENGGEALYVRADVREPKQIAAFVEAAMKAHGRIDIAYNNAGIGNVPGGGRLHEITAEHWQDLNRTNYEGIFYAMKYELPVMLAQKRGVIVNQTSTLGVVSLPRVGAYSASKHGVVGLTRVAALDYARDGIRINAVAPGPIQTTFLNQFISPEDPAYAAVVASIENKVPLKRWGQPDDIARMVLFVASDDASFLHGHVLAVDGGMGAHEGSASEDRLG